jgi:hypothetical protein
MTTPTAETTTQGTPILLAVYRHDVHKLRNRAHAHAADTVAGVPVNEKVPLEADADAASLSRPAETPEQTVANHVTPQRLSLCSGQPASTTPALEIPTESAIAPLVTANNPAVAHARWLTSRVAAAYNESPYYPYTSLHYHTLLTATLLDAYCADYNFADLSLVATPPATDGPPSLATTRDPQAARETAIVEPHRTVLWTPACALHVTFTPDGRPSAPLGEMPARSFADTWSRLSAHPIDTDTHRGRLLDAQLRRIRAWSTALAYLDDFVSTYGQPADNPNTTETRR